MLHWWFVLTKANKSFHWHSIPYILLLSSSVLLLCQAMFPPLWLNIISIIINVFLWESNGRFNFKHKGKLYAVGLSNYWLHVLQLYWYMFLALVSHSLNGWHQQLAQHGNKAPSSQVVKLMKLLLFVHTSTLILCLYTESTAALFPIQWITLLKEFQTSIYNTAFLCYYAWHYCKNKDGDQPIESSSKKHTLSGGAGAVAGFSKCMQQGWG